MALGASCPAVLRMVVGQGMRLVIIGVAVGLVAALAATRLLRSMLFNVRSTDPVTFIVVAAAFLVAGAVACLGPAWRATTVDPMLALRAE
jgi:ABC-type antimicrobial peptide transport system permease subunit